MCYKLNVVDVLCIEKHIETHKYILNYQHGICGDSVCCVYCVIKYDVLPITPARVSGLLSKKKKCMADGESP